MAHKCGNCGYRSGHASVCPWSDPSNTPAKEADRLAEALAKTRAYLLSTPCSTCGVKHLGACA